MDQFTKVDWFLIMLSVVSLFWAAVIVGFYSALN